MTATQSPEERFQDFLRSYSYDGEYKYRKRLGHVALAGSRSLVVDFEDLIAFDPELARYILDKPDEYLDYLDRSAWAQLKIEDPEYAEVIKRLRIRFRKLPEKHSLRVIGSENIGRMLCIDGIIVRSTSVKPLLIKAAFQCRKCNAMTYIEQAGVLMRGPGVCPHCKSKVFEFMEKLSTFMNSQEIRIQERPEDLPPGQLPRAMDIKLSEDMVDIARPGDRVSITGVARAQQEYIGRKARLRTFDLLLDANYVDIVGKEVEVVEITPEDERLIRELAKDPFIHRKLIASLAPSIYGYGDIKEAVLYLLFGGVPKRLPDGVTIRSEVNVLLVGDPGCLVSDERVVLGNGTITKIGEVGRTHLQPLKTQVLTGQGGARRAYATRFHIYRKQRILEVITESGKSIKGTFNHPLLAVNLENGSPIRRWRRLDEFKVGDRVAVVTWFPCTIKNYVYTKFQIEERRLGPRFRGKLPRNVTPELGSLLGYMLGDGWVQRYRCGFLVAESERDLLGPLTLMTEKLFGIRPRVSKRKRRNGRTVPIYEVVIGSEDIASNIAFLRNKRVPEIILSSGNRVVSRFLRWLYEADGSVFEKGHGSRAITLKAKDIELLRDIQVLLLRFGIHSRIVGNALLIRRGYDIIKFHRKIGFASRKKRQKLANLARAARSFRRVHSQRSERIVKILEHEPADVYDIEVPQGHRFIANGIISHNTAKSQLLQYVSRIAPRGLYTSGRGTSLDYEQPIIIRRDGDVKIEKIGELVDEYYGDEESGFFATASGLECLSYDESTGHVSWSPVSHVFRHRHNHPLLKLTLQTGREITVTPNHSIYIFRDGRLSTIPTSQIRKGDYVAIPGRARATIENSRTKVQQSSDPLTWSPDLARLLGYYVAEGYLHQGTPGHESYRIHFELNRRETAIIKDIADCSETLFGIKPTVRPRRNSRGVTVTISNKTAFMLFRYTLAVSQGAKNKRVPDIIYRMTPELQAQFLQAYIDGDRGVTASHFLISDILYLLTLSTGVVGKFTKRKPSSGWIQGRRISGGPHYQLKAPSPYNMRRQIKPLGVPIVEALIPIQKVQRSPKSGAGFAGNGYERLTNRVFAYLMRGRRAKRLARLQLLTQQRWIPGQDYASKIHLPSRQARAFLQRCNHDGLVQRRYENGRLLVTLTEQGQEAINETSQLRTIIHGDLQFAKVREIQTQRPSTPYVYDVSVPGRENFVAGFGGVLCHNTAAGLTAAVVREKSGGMVLEAGALVLADKGIACIDEIDKMRPEDRVAIHESLEQHTVSVAKGGIVATLNARAAVLAAANPSLGRYDPYRNITDNINLPVTLLTRFDLLFIMKDIPEADSDGRMSEHILTLHRMKTTPEEPPLMPDLLRKYIAYAKRIEPILTEDSVNAIRQYYLKMRSLSGSAESPVAITPRQLEALVRLAEARARSFLRDRVEAEDAQAIIRLMTLSLQDVGIDTTTGKIDIDVIMTGKPKSLRDKMQEVLSTFADLEKQLGIVEDSTLYQALTRKPDIAEDDARRLVDQLVREGILYSPKPGHLKRTAA